MKRLTFPILGIFACLLLGACKENHPDIDPHTITRVIITDSYGSISTKNRHDIKTLISTMNKAVPDDRPRYDPKITTIELYFNNKPAYTIKANKSFFNIEEIQYFEKTGAFEDAVSAIRNSRREKSAQDKLDYLQEKIEKI